MNVPTLSPGNRGYELVTITMTSAMDGVSDARAAESQPPRHDERFEQDRRRHFRLPLSALDEDDRHFADPQAAAMRLVQHLDEKRVAVGHHLVDRHALKRI